MTQGNVESHTSRTFRRVAGLSGIAALLVAITAGALGFRTVATYSFALFLAVPWLAFTGHLNVTGCLTEDEKAVWRNELSIRWNRSRALIALWAYLFAHDLSSRTRGFAPYQSH